MSLRVNFSVSGIDEITSRLEDIKSAVSNFNSSYPGQIAGEMVSKMQSIAPVDTGYMRDHISVSDSSAGRATVVSEADYSKFVEFGTRFMSAQPFFFVVVDEYSVSQIIDDFKSEVGI